MSFFTPSPFTRGAYAPVPSWDEPEDIPDPYGNMPSVRITADIPDTYRSHRTVDEDTDEQYLCHG